MADDIAAKIGIDDLVEAAANGALRALKVRDIAAAELVRSGFTVNIGIIAGGPFLSRGALNPQPLPPVDVGSIGSPGQ